MTSDRVTAVGEQHLVNLPVLELLHEGHPAAVQAHVEAARVVEAQDVLEILTAPVEMELIQEGVVVVHNLHDVGRAACTLRQPTW